MAESFGGWLASASCGAFDVVKSDETDYFRRVVEPGGLELLVGPSWRHTDLLSVRFRVR